MIPMLPFDKSEPMMQSDTSCADGRSRSERLELEIARQATIYREGIDPAILKRAAIRALMERGEY